MPGRIMDSEAARALAAAGQIIMASRHTDER
jgi:hypothetical protein